MDSNLHDILFYFDIITIFTFIVEIFLNFITGYKFNGLTIMDIKKIFNNYLKGYFIMDIIVVISMIVLLILMIALP